MKTLHRILATGVALFMAIGLADPALGDLSVTATLLPTREALVSPAQDQTAFPHTPPSAADPTWLYVAPGKEEALLEFDLSAIPADAKIRRCSLRLVAETANWSADRSKWNPVTNQLLKASLVKPNAWKDGVPDWSATHPPLDDRSIVALSMLQGDSKPPRLVALNAIDTDLRTTVADIVKGSGTKRLQLRVFSETRDSSSRLFSSQGDCYNKRPRLVVQYQAQPSLANEVAWRQYQFGPEHTGLCPVFQYPPPDGYVPGYIIVRPSALEIRTDPVVYDDQIILVVFDEKENWLYALNYAGTLVWQTSLQHNLTVPKDQHQPAVSLDGILYQSWYKIRAGLDHIAGYDLKQRAAKAFERSADSLAGKPTFITELTVGNDGSLFFAAGQWIYGLTRTLDPFLQIQVSELPKGVTVSQDGRWLYASTSKGLIVVDLINPPIVPVSPFENGKDINNPTQPLFVSKETLSVALPDSKPTSTAVNPPKLATSSIAGVNVLKLKLSDEDENVVGVDTFWRAESATTMTNSPPVLGIASTLYFIQSGKLSGRGTDFSDKPSRDAKQTALEIQSNLVIDGNERLTFWQAPTYWVFDGHGTEGKDQDISEPTLKSQKIDFSKKNLESPKEALRWIIGPDGTRYAQNQSYIFTLRPRYTKSSSLELTQKELTQRHQTILAPTPIKVSTSNPLVINSGTDRIFESSEGFRVPGSSSFRVEKGARVSIRIAPDLKP